MIPDKDEDGFLGLVRRLTSDLDIDTEMRWRTEDANTHTNRISGLLPPDNLIRSDENNHRGRHGQRPRLFTQFSRLRIMLKVEDDGESFCFENDNMEIDNSVSGQKDFLFLTPSHSSMVIEADV